MAPPEARERAGLSAGSNLYRVVALEDVFDFDEKTSYMKLLAISESVEVKDILEKMDFEPMLADKIDDLSHEQKRNLMSCLSTLPAEVGLSAKGSGSTSSAPYRMQNFAEFRLGL
jgi:hypothetical protein